MSVEIGRTRFGKYSEGEFNRGQQKFGYRRILVWVYLKINSETETQRNIQGTLVWGRGRETREGRQPLKSEVLSQLLWASLVAQQVKTLPAGQKMQEMGVRSLGQEDPLEEGMATHSCILSQIIPWTEEPGEL